MDYQALQDMARASIASLGREVILRTVTASDRSWDNDSEEISAENRVDKKVNAIQGRFEASSINGQSIQATDIKFTVDADFEPKDGMTLIDGDTEYQVKNVFATKPGPIVIKYDIRVVI